MKIGFDAKRAYHNATGLGFFSRVLISLLAEHFPQHEYFLFNPKPGRLFKNSAPNLHEVLPQKRLHRLFTSAWRSNWVTADLKKLDIRLFHGLSHEIPLGLSATGIASVVSVHDMFPETHPQDYKPLDVRIYRAKTRYACHQANRIMAISEATKKEIVDLYHISPEKIDVVYQSCDPIFSIIRDKATKERVREKYGLPRQFFLHVGSIIERKNLLNICKALQRVRGEIDIPLVVIGKGGVYKQKVKEYLNQQNLNDRVIFLFDELEKTGQRAFIKTEDLPAVYQLATALIYPSFYEGFGIPLVEAMSGGVPVITSTTSCLPEIGGPGAFLADPNRPEELAEGLRKIYGNKEWVKQMRQKSFEHIKLFAPERYARNLMDMYLKTV